MNDYKDFADQLGEETIREMADDFFGARRDVEDMKETLERNAAKLARRLDILADTAHVFQDMLLGPENARAFYAALGVDPEPFLALADRGQGIDEADEDCGRAVTRGGKYKKVVLDVYDHLRQLVDAYLNGVWETDESGRKVLSLSFRQLEEFAEQVNARVGVLNECRKPSSSLQFVRSMNVEEADKANAIGGTLEGFCNLDEELALEPVDFDALGLPALPELPPRDKLPKAAKDIFDVVYSTDKDRANAAVRQLCR